MLRIWETWSVYPQTFLTGLQASFLQQFDALEGSSASNVGGSSKHIEDVDGEPLVDEGTVSGLEGLESKSTREIELMCKANGVMSGARNDMISRLKSVERFSREKQRAGTVLVSFEGSEGHFLCT